MVNFGLVLSGFRTSSVLPCGSEHQEAGLPLSPDLGVLLLAGFHPQRQTGEEGAVLAAHHIMCLQYGSSQ